MNLRVDLILESEQRSGSLISLKLILRVVYVIVPLIILLAIGSMVTGVLKLSGEAKSLERRWADAAPKKEAAAKLRGDLARNDSALQEVEGWRGSRIAWNSQLAGLHRIVPDTLQFRSLRIGQSIQIVEGTSPARLFTMVLNGKATGRDAQTSVQQLREHLAETEVFSDLVESVEVTKYGADPTEGADKFDRIFEIECRYRARPFE